MAAATYDILIEQGATFTYNITYKDGAGSPIDLAGYTARMQVRRTHDAPTPLLTLTTENGAITLGGALGTITVVASATMTADLPAKDAVYDLEIVNGSVVTRLVEGAVAVTPEVTR